MSIRGIVLPVALLTAGIASAETEAEHARFHQLEALFAGATVVGTPEIASCTLSGGAEASCMKITVVAAPSDHLAGPFCPRTITDDATQGGTWFVDGEVRDVDGPFIAGLAEIYGDDTWQMYDPETGKVRFVDRVLGCEVAGDPNSADQYENTCVECELGYMGSTVTQTYFIPLTPVAAATPEAGSGIQSGIALAFNGVKMDAPAPLDLILGGHTLGPFDDCGGHINPKSGYHYHGILDDCGPRVAAKVEKHAPLIGITMDGYDLYDRLDADGTEPSDLDACRGHVVEGLGYHYHVNAAAKNQIINCFSAQTGCSLEDADAPCNQEAHEDRRGPPPGDGPPAGAAQKP